MLDKRLNNVSMLDKSTRNLEVGSWEVGKANANKNWGVPIQKNIWKCLYKNYIINRISCRVPGYLEMASCCLENWRQLPVALKGEENFLLPWDGSFFWRRNAPAKPRVGVDFFYQFGRLRLKRSREAPCGLLEFFWLGCKPLGRALENLAIAWVEHRELEVCLVTTKRIFLTTFAMRVARLEVPWRHIWLCADCRIRCSESM